jgi:hypothetical protein
VKTGCNLAESSKEGCGSKKAILPTTTTNNNNNNNNNNNKKMMVYRTSSVLADWQFIEEISLNVCRV